MKRLWVALFAVAMLLAAASPALAQPVTPSKSGMVEYFEGTVYLDGQALTDPIVAQFPYMKENGSLHEDGRAQNDAHDHGSGMGKTHRTAQCGEHEGSAILLFCGGKPSQNLAVQRVLGAIFGFMQFVPPRGDGGVWPEDGPCTPGKSPRMGMKHRHDG